MKRNPSITLGSYGEKNLEGINEKLNKLGKKSITLSEACRVGLYVLNNQRDSQILKALTDTRDQEDSI